MDKTLGDVLGFVDGFNHQIGQELLVDYTTKLVAFVDILGMRNYIKNESHSVEVINTMNRFAQIVKEVCYGTNFQYIIMGDGVAIIADVDYFVELCDRLMYIQVKIMKELHMAIRGALTAGDVTVLNDGKIIVGPAFVEAFELESEVAIYPRIIISCNAMEIHDNCAEKFSHIKMDFDQNYIIDFVSAVKTTFNNPELVLADLRKMAEQKVQEQKNKKSCKIIQKYGWLKNILES